MLPLTPEAITSLTALVAIMERVANWPFFSLLLVLVIGPWVLSLFMSYTDRKRLEQVVAMYEHNVHLVESYKEIASDMKEVVTLNTQAWVGVEKAISANEFCPVIRAKHTTLQSIRWDPGKGE